MPIATPPTLLPEGKSMPPPELRLISAVPKKIVLPLRYKSRNFLEVLPKSISSVVPGIRFEVIFDGLNSVGVLVKES